MTAEILQKVQAAARNRSSEKERLRLAPMQCTVLRARTQTPKMHSTSSQTHSPHAVLKVNSVAAFGLPVAVQLQPVKSHLLPAWRATLCSWFRPNYSAFQPIMNGDADFSGKRTPCGQNIEWLVTCILFYCRNLARTFAAGKLQGKTGAAMIVAIHKMTRKILTSSKNCVHRRHWGTRSDHSRSIGSIITSDQPQSNFILGIDCPRPCGQLE